MPPVTALPKHCRSWIACARRKFVSGAWAYHPEKSIVNNWFAFLWKSLLCKNLHLLWKLSIRVQMIIGCAFGILLLSRRVGGCEEILSKHADCWQIFSKSLSSEPCLRQFGTISELNLLRRLNSTTLRDAWTWQTDTRRYFYRTISLSQCKFQEILVSTADLRQVAFKCLNQPSESGLKLESF